MLNQKFKPPPTEPVSSCPHPQPSSPRTELPTHPGCSSHPNASLWLQLGMPPDAPLADYRCMLCHPPPSPVFVQRLITSTDLDASAQQSQSVLTTPGVPRAATENAYVASEPTEPVVVNYGQSACKHCHSRLVSERMIGERFIVTCWSCRQPIDNWQDLWP